MIYKRNVGPNTHSTQKKAIGKEISHNPLRHWNTFNLLKYK